MTKILQYIMGRKEKWIDKKKKGVKPGSVMDRFNHLVDWDESYRNRNWYKKELWKIKYLGWLDNIIFQIKLRKLSRKIKRKNKK
tara:strand:+ start:729 stop:980 length:252 start_codon:yes stop_codon:yes gene_type:complete